jgi:hypothetical protein
MKWEYRVVQLPLGEFRGLNQGNLADSLLTTNGLLNKLGAEGWEAVSLAVGGDYNPFVLFKRQLR